VKIYKIIFLILFFGSTLSKGKIKVIKKNSKIFDEFKYKFPNDNLNPFSPPDLSEFSSKKYNITVVSDLQKVKLEKIKLVGVWVEKEGVSKCLLTAKGADGLSVGVVATVGEFVGRKGGKIKSINKNNIVIKLYTVLSNGTKKYYDKVMYIEDLVKNEKTTAKKDIIIYK
jgi:Tfp pilus assembly protein PilP